MKTGEPKIIHYQKNPLCPSIYSNGVMCKCGIISPDNVHQQKKVTCTECLAIMKKEKEFSDRYRYHQNGGANGCTGHGDICMSDADIGL